MKFLQELEGVLKSDERFVSQDGQLLKPRVRDAVSQLDAKLIRSLTASPLLKEHFFKNVDGITIFEQEKFMWVVSSKEFLPDSYTAYRNKIGLSANDHDLISASSEVTLGVKGQNVCLARRVAGVRFGLFECRLSGCSRCR